MRRNGRHSGLTFEEVVTQMSDEARQEDKAMVVGAQPMPPARMTERDAALEAQLPVVAERAAVVRALELDERIQSAVLGVLAGPGGPYMASFGPKARLNAAGASRLARAYGISVQEVSATRVEYEGDGRSEWYWEVSVRATGRDGRVVEASDICTSEDGIHTGMTRDGRQTATIGQRLQTTRKHARERAERQAISELVGLRGVSTEECQRLGIPLESVAYRGGKGGANGAE
jgi:hypothetical protein